MTALTSTGLAGALALFTDAADYARQALAGVRERDLDRPTPCPGWDLRTLLLHLAESGDTLVNLATTGEMAQGAEPRGATDPVAAAQAGIDGLRTALNAASGSQSDGAKTATEWATSAGHAGTIEFLAHGWDISVACGSPHEIPTDLADEVLQLATSLLTDAARAPAFAPAVRLPGTATAGDRLMAFLGRHPVASRGNSR